MPKSVATLVEDLAGVFVSKIKVVSDTELSSNINDNKWKNMVLTCWLNTT